MFKKIIEIIKLLFVRNPAKYIEKMGVNLGKNIKFIIYPYFWSYPKIGSEPYLISIGDDTLISFDVTFITHDGSVNCFNKKEKYKNIVRFGKIKIGNNCFIGCKTIIMQNVTIGDDCIVGAGSIVTKNIPDGEVWAGVPAKFIGYTKDLGEKYLKQTPKYDNKNLQLNRKEEILKIVEGE